LNRTTPAGCRSNGLAKTLQHRVSLTWRRLPLSVARLGIENQLIVLSNAKGAVAAGRLAVCVPCHAIAESRSRPCYAVETDNNRNWRPKRQPIYHPGNPKTVWKTLHPLLCRFLSINGTYICCFYTRHDRRLGLCSSPILCVRLIAVCTWSHPTHLLSSSAQVEYRIRNLLGTFPSSLSTSNRSQHY
jgi:hypothetical protein